MPQQDAHLYLKARCIIIATNCAQHLMVRNRAINMTMSQSRGFSFFCKFTMHSLCQTFVIPILVSQQFADLTLWALNYIFGMLPDTRWAITQAHFVRLTAQCHNLHSWKNRSTKNQSYNHVLGSNPWSNWHDRAEL